MNKNKINLLEGNLWKQILLFALPIVATSMLQQLFNSVDTAVVGRFSSSDALAAVGSTSSVVGLSITIMSGLSVGANVIISHAIGQRNNKTIKNSVDTSLCIGLIAGILLAVVSEIIARPMLDLLGTPSNIIDQATSYLRIYFIGLPFLMLYNFAAAILRSSGDSNKPLYCLIVSGVLNLGFNLLFVVGFRMGVVGVALGTLISDVANMIIIFYFLLKGNGIVKFDIHNFSPDKHSAMMIFKIGIPAALQGMMFNLSNLIIQSGFNSLGSQVVAANTVALNAEVFVYFLLNGFGQAAVTFFGQNYGAGNYRRCRMIPFVCMILGSVSTLILSFIFIQFSNVFTGIFTTDATVVELAVSRMKMVLYFEVLNLTVEVLSGCLRGLGHSTIPTVISALFICGTRILWMLFVFPNASTYETLIRIYPISWALASFATLFVYLYIQKQKLDRIDLQNAN